MRNIFVEKSYKKCAGQAIPRPFSNCNFGSILIFTVKTFWPSKQLSLPDGPNYSGLCFEAFSFRGLLFRFLHLGVLVLGSTCQF